MSDEEKNVESVETTQENFDTKKSAANTEIEILDPPDVVVDDHSTKLANGGCENGSEEAVATKPKSVHQQQIRRSLSWSHANSSSSSLNEQIVKSSILPIVNNEASVSPTPSELSLSMVVKPASASLGCEMCSNYELRLQQLQDNERRLRQQLTSSQVLSERYKSELSSERNYRSEVESRFSGMTLQTDQDFKSSKAQIAEFEEKVRVHEDLVGNKLASYRKEFEQAVKNRLSVEEQMGRLKMQYDKLLGKHRAQADVMQREAIDLPQTTEDLQLFALQLREELIEVKAAREHLEESLKSEILFMREQLTSEQQSKEQLEQALSEEINNLRTELAIVKSQQTEVESLSRQLLDSQRQLDEHRSTIGDLEGALAILKHEKAAAEASNREHRQRSLVLQQELDNCEQVQKDFVRLSQSLQIELEKIRQADHEVRWQHEDDVLVCNGCKIAFTRQRRKVHCRHCGRIFCETCLSKSVPSGPQQRSSHVCDVCHTLLVRDTAPYFSSQVPSTVSTGGNG